MNQRIRVPLLALAMCMFAMTSLAQTPQNSVQNAAATRVIDVTARKYVFEPSPIHVKQGAHVQLKITATDRAHGFQIDVYPEGAETKGEPGLVFASSMRCYKIEKHQTETVEFVARTPGTYHFKCCVHCGLHHGAMKGELVVDP